MASYAHTRPTIRSNILTARFMGSSPIVRIPWEREPSQTCTAPWEERRCMRGIIHSNASIFNDFHVGGF